jgi:hypothetical protein
MVMKWSFEYDHPRIGLQDRTRPHRGRFILPRGRDLSGEKLALPYPRVHPDSIARISRPLRQGSFEDVDTEDHRTSIFFPKFRMCGRFIHFTATDVRQLVTAVTAVVPVVHAPHVTASPVKS